MKKFGLMFLFVLSILYFIFLIQQDIIDNIALKRDVGQTAKMINKQEELSSKMRARLANLKKNKYLEELARTRLGFVKAGETSYKVIRR
ncbi:MAG: septum formation initiator family protein [bacterium]|nr:septum formation initiator family protein [Candidatus Margulisiibacteriota bacterium]